MNQSLVETSKLLSFILRHKPEAFGIALDKEGWAEIESLIAATANTDQSLDHELINKVVITSDKKRFAISEDGLRIRAVQGHSTDQVDIAYTEKVPPSVLYHGTATRFLDAIHRDGLLPGSRQYVHLSNDRTTALAVGRRHGQPVVIEVDALAMYQQGFKFYQADNGVWLVEHVPFRFINI